MTTAQVVETSVTVNNNSPIQDYVHPDDQTQPTFEMTPGFKPFTHSRNYQENGYKLSAQRFLGSLREDKYRRPFLINACPQKKFQKSLVPFLPRVSKEGNWFWEKWIILVRNWGKFSESLPHWYYLLFSGVITLGTANGPYANYTIKPRLWAIFFSLTLSVHEYSFQPFYSRKPSQTCTILVGLVVWNLLVRAICYWPCGIYTKLMCYKRLWRTNKKGLFPFKRQ